MAHSGGLVDMRMPERVQMAHSAEWDSHLPGLQADQLDCNCPPGLVWSPSHHHCSNSHADLAAESECESGLPEAQRSSW